MMRHYLISILLISSAGRTQAAIPGYTISGAFIGSGLALLVTAHNAIIHDEWDNMLTNAISGGVVGALIGGIADLLSTKYSPEEQKYYAALANAQELYTSGLIIMNTHLADSAQDRKHLRAHYNYLLEQKKALSINCRRLMTNKSVGSERTTLQDKHEKLHTQICELLTTYKERLNLLYGNETWQEQSNETSAQSPLTGKLSTSANTSPQRIVR